MICFFIFIRFLFVRSRSKISYWHAEEIQKIAQKRNFDLNNQQQYLEAVDEFLAETAEKGFDNSVWQRICANFRLLLRRLGLDIAYSDDELRELFRRSRNALRMQQQLSGTNGENGTRFAVDGNGNQLFNVNGYGQMTISEIINNKNISKQAEILTDSGNNIWGKITEDMAKAGKEFNLEALPIKFFKGDKWFGLVHIYKHLSEFQNQNLSNLMEVIFGDINKIYARNDNGKIKLEIFPVKSRYYGILELRNDMDCYSIVSFYTRKLQFEKPKGKKVWVRSPQSAKSHATNDQSTLNVAPDKMLQEFQKELTAQNNININPLQADIKPEIEKNQKKLRFSLKNGGYGLAHIRKRHPDVNWDKIVDTINNGKIENAGKGKKVLISDDGKVILFINQKGRNWVITAFSKTSAEEILSASAKNGSDAFYRKGITTIGEVWENASENQKKLRFSLKNGENAARFAVQRMRFKDKLIS